MTRYAIIDTRVEPRKVVDIVEIDETIDDATGQPREILNEQPPYFAVGSDDAQVGWVFDGEELSAG